MKKIDAGLMQEYLDRKTGNGHFSSPSWIKFYRDRAWWLLRLKDGTIFCFEKTKIKTDFCFGESGYDYDEAGRKARQATQDQKLFKVRNLRWIDEQINALERKRKYESLPPVWIWPQDGVADRLGYNCYEWDTSVPAGAVVLGEEDRASILETLKWLRGEYEKKIDAYLKRYGLSKVTSWTYWRDA